MFSTCTVADEENIQTAEKFLREHKNFQAVNIENMPKMLYENTPFWQILPQKHNIDGFFLAKFQRIY